VTPEKALELAIDRAGGIKAVAGLFDITVQAIYGWGVCPPKRVLALEEAAGGAVTKHQLRPDIYGPPP